MSAATLIRAEMSRSGQRSTWWATHQTRPRRAGALVRRQDRYRVVLDANFDQA